jgi:hypothetical protein
MIPWLIAIHLTLLLTCIGYAALLQRIYRHYHPDRTYITVVVGEMLVGLAFGGAWLVGAVSLEAVALFGTLQMAAGIPIVAWQLDQAARRRKIRSGLERDSHAAQARGARDA